MKIAVRLAFLAGAVAMIALIAREGVSAILTPLYHAGFVLLWLVPFHAAPLLLDVLGWHNLLLRKARVTTLFWIASVREALNRLLPVANIGGEIVGIRLLAHSGVDGTVAAASVIVETLLTIVSVYLFVAIGVVCLLQMTGTTQLTRYFLIALVMTLPLIALIATVLRYGSLFTRLKQFAEKLCGDRLQTLQLPGKLASLDTEIGSLLAAAPRLTRSALWQLAGLIAGSGETWLALRWLGHPVSPTAALVLESLTQAARHFIFLVPAGIGVQEGVLVSVGHLLGVGSDLALALSLAKRMRELLFGLPVLLAWWWTEAKRHYYDASSGV